MPQESTSPQSRIVSPGNSPDSVCDAEGNRLQPPSHWSFLPAGDATLTRRVKKDTDHWVVQTKKGRRTFTKGIWASSETIDQHLVRWENEKSDPKRLRKLEQSRERQKRVYEQEAKEFRAAVMSFLDFHPRHTELADRLATAVSDHASPVGSGTVARARRLRVEEKAKAAVIAWLRHQTTNYEQRKIPRKKGARRAVRRQLAEQSQSLLELYRGDSSLKFCPLTQALDRVEKDGESLSSHP